MTRLATYSGLQSPDLLWATDCRLKTSFELRTVDSDLQTPDYRQTTNAKRPENNTPFHNKASF